MVVVLGSQKLVEICWNFLAQFVMSSYSRDKRL